MKAAELFPTAGEETISAPVASIGRLSQKAKAALEHNGLRSVCDVVSRDRGDVAAMPLMAPMIVDEIATTLAAMALCFADDEPPPAVAAAREAIAAELAARAPGPRARASERQRELGDDGAAAALGPIAPAGWVDEEEAERKRQERLDQWRRDAEEAREREERKGRRGRPKREAAMEDGRHDDEDERDGPEGPEAPEPSRPSDAGKAELGADLMALGLPGRGRGALRRAGLTTLDEVADRTEREVFSLPGLGPDTITALKAAMDRRGLSFAKDGLDPDDIASLHLKPNVLAILAAAGIGKVSDLVTRSQSELLALPGFSYYYAKGLKGILAARGLALRRGRSVDPRVPPQDATPDARPESLSSTPMPMLAGFAATPTRHPRRQAKGGAGDGVAGSLARIIGEVVDEKRWRDIISMAATQAAGGDPEARSWLWAAALGHLRA